MGFCSDRSCECAYKIWVSRNTVPSAPGPVYYIHGRKNWLICGL